MAKAKTARRERKEIRSAQPDLVDFGAAMNEQKTRMEGALDRVKAVLREEADEAASEGVGIVEVHGTRGYATVVYGRPKYVVKVEALATARDLLGERFDAFFATETTATPTEAFAELFQKLPVRMRKRLAPLVTIEEGPTQVRFGKLVPEVEKAEKAAPAKAAG